jgi:hypothetical protein
MADQLHSKLSHRKMPISDQKSLFMKECYHLMWMFLNGKGQLISKCLFGAIVSTKKPTKFLKNFCPSL